MTEQRGHLGLSAPKCLEDLHGRLAASECQHGFPKAPPGFDHGCRIFQSRFFESPKGVRGEHFGPLVAVVARRVPSTENMAEAAQEAVLIQQRKHSVALGHPTLNRESAAGFARDVLVVQSQIGQ